MKYIIFVRNEEESKKAQDNLFIGGKGWDGGKTKTYRYLKAPFLYMKSENNELTYGESFLGAAKDVVNEKCALLEICDINKTFPPFPPERMVDIDGIMWSLSTIKEMLRERINK